MVILSAVRNAFHKYPFLFNAISYGGLYVAGDITQQKLREVEKMNWKGTRNIGIISGGLIGPGLYHWYIWLDKVLPGNTKRIVLKKMFLDQALSIPIIMVFFTGISLLERKPDIFKEAREKTLKTWLTACCFWPPVQAINFFILPTRFRTLYVGAAAYVWSIIFCFYKAADTKHMKLKEIRHHSE